jgi:signal transduction histidine kinase
MRELDRGSVEPGRLRAALETIDRQSSRLGQLIARLLDVARLESGRLSIEPRPTDLRALVGGIVEVAQRGAPAHRLSVVGGPVEAEVDAMRLEQVVSNLVDNAVKYSPSGGEVVVELAAAERELRLSVRDQGIGVPPERRRFIFDRFYQAHADWSPGGMGLGLYVSSQIVRLHGGRLEAEFPDDGGSCFVVTLPRQPPFGDNG